MQDSNVGEEENFRERMQKYSLFYGMPKWGPIVFVIALCAIGLALGMSSNRARATTNDVATFRSLPSTTVGNHTWIALPQQFLDDYSELDERGRGILQVVDGFEKANPQLHVTRWTIDQVDGSWVGVWIDHEPVH